MNITLDQNTAQRVQRFQASLPLGESQTPSQVIANAMMILEQLEHSMRTRIDEGIQRGLNDVEAGRTTPLPSSGSLDSFVDSILK